MATVFIAPLNKVIEVQAGQSVMAAIKSAGIYLRASCGGHASCGDCVVKISSGEEHLGPMEFAEQRLLGNVYHLTKERLSCQCFLDGQAHLAIDLSAHDEQADQTKRSKLVKRRPGGGLSRPARAESEKTTAAGPVNERAGGGRRPRMFATPEDNETDKTPIGASVPKAREQERPQSQSQSQSQPPKFPRKKFRSSN